MGVTLTPIVLNPKFNLALLVLLGTRWAFGLRDGPIWGVCPQIPPVPPRLGGEALGLNQPRSQRTFSG